MQRRPFVAIALVCILIALPSARSVSASPSMTPSDIRAAYDVGPLLNNGYSGKGVTVAVINTGIDSTFYSDISGFSQEFGLPVANISVVTPFGTSGTGSELPAGETTADVEFVHSMAPDADILLVLTGATSILSGFSYVLDNHAADVATLSPSWAYWGNGAMQTVLGYNTEYSKSVQEGITLIAASNDWGSNNSVPWGQVEGGFWYDYLPDSYLMPQYSPYVTAVGGTNLYLNGLGYGSETGWNRSGGGPSNLFQQPNWQTGFGVPHNGMRDMPDIALDASCETPYSFYWKGSPSYTFCGTSAGAPTFAGIVADIDQAAGRSLGFLNPLLYSISSTDSAAFHDVTSGCSGVRSGSGVATGYCAGSGWDYVTGLGSIDSARFAVDLVSGLSIVTSTTSTTLPTTSSSSSVLMTSTAMTSSTGATTSTGHSSSASSASSTTAISSVTSGLTYTTAVTSSSSALQATTSSPGGGIPEFPYQILGVALVAVLVGASYLMVRRPPNR